MSIVDLSATDATGTSESLVKVAITRNLKVGLFTLSFNDLTIPVSGVPIQITRTYDSRDKAPGDFGFGWRPAFIRWRHARR